MNFNKNKKMISLLLAFALLFSVYNAGAVPQSEIKIVYEPKIFSRATIDDDFCGQTVLVVMDKNVGGQNVRHNARFFGDIPKTIDFYQ
jgi:hypothetical protein